MPDMAKSLQTRSPLGMRLVEHREAIIEAAARRHARNGRVFGSVARGEDRPDSDVDLLELECDLEDELGVRVDVGSPSSLRPVLRDEVIAEALAL